MVWPANRESITSTDSVTTSQPIYMRSENSLPRCSCSNSCTTRATRMATEAAKKRMSERHICSGHAHTKRSHTHICPARDKPRLLFDRTCLGVQSNGKLAVMYLIESFRNRVGWLLLRIPFLSRLRVG
jgi:hypothetical protein